jgi:hypothetical protein
MGTGVSPPLLPPETVGFQASVTENFRASTSNKDPKPSAD